MTSLDCLSTSTSKLQLIFHNLNPRSLYIYSHQFTSTISSSSFSSINSPKNIIKFIMNNIRTAAYEEQASVIVIDDEIAKPGFESEDTVVPGWSRPDIFNTEEMMVQRVEQGSNEYEILERSFVGGNKKKIEIVGIHRKRYDWGVMDEARLAVFRVFAGAVAGRNGGSSNVRFGWYGGGGRDEVREIMMYGFRRFEKRGAAFGGGGGGGVLLSPANSPMERVILGRPEVVHLGSQKDQPSSMKFDSGVIINDTSSPTKYVIWEHHMNTHILPAYIISFRVEDSSRGTRSLKMPTSLSMGINSLMSRLTNYLSSSKIAAIKKLHHEYHKSKISRSTFIRNLRAIAGDDVLRTMIQGRLR